MLTALTWLQTVREQSAGPTRRLARALWRLHVIDVSGIVLGIFAVATVLAGVYLWFAAGVPIHDVHIYELAGARVNAGGMVYDLRPADPFPPGEDRSLPLYGPPTIVLPWRILTFLPGSLGAGIWIFSMALATLTGVIYLILGTRGWAGLAVLVWLGLPVVVLVGVANVDSVVMCGALATWSLRNRPRLCGILVGSIVALKLTPALLLIWLIGTRRFLALLWAGAAIAGLAFVTALATEPDIWFRYLGVARDVVVSGRSESLLFALLGSVLVLAFGAHLPGLTFAIAVFGMPLGSPQAGNHSWAVAIACLMPLVDVMRPRVAQERFTLPRKGWRSRASVPSTSDDLAGSLRR